MSERVNIFDCQHRPSLILSQLPMVFRRLEAMVPLLVLVCGLHCFRNWESQVIIPALKVASGTISGKRTAAERLGLKRTTLQNKMRRLNIIKDDY
jgi:transcriptional regulator with GAF, ATPase, and Fis domain